MEDIVEWTVHYWQEQINESFNCHDDNGLVFLLTGLCVASDPVWQPEPVHTLKWE